MHLIKATVIKAILTGTAATATVSAGVVLTSAAVEFSTGNYAEASAEIETDEDHASGAEAYVSSMIASQEGDGVTDSNLIDTTDSDQEIYDTGAVHDNVVTVNNTDISRPVKTAAPDQTAGGRTAGSIESTGGALAGNTVTHANTDSSLGSAVNSTENTTVNTGDSPVSTTPDNSSVNATSDSTNSSVNTAADNGNDSASAATDNGNDSVSAAADTTNTSISTAMDNSNGSVNTAVSADNSAPSVADSGNSPVNTASNADNGSNTASSGSVSSLPNFDHATSIYDSNGSLLRVEYYVEDQNLPAEYSSVADFDKDTNSYTETVYRYDTENEASVVVRTDTYVNGELVSSEAP